MCCLTIMYIMHGSHGIATVSWTQVQKHYRSELQWRICTRANLGICPGTLINNNDIHNWFNYQNRREGAQAVIFSFQKPPKPRFRDVKIQNFPGGEPQTPLLHLLFNSTWTSIQTQIRHWWAENDNDLYDVNVHAHGLVNTEYCYAMKIKQGR